jgi:hypothetical protein
MESDLPTGHDVVLLANIIHYFLPEQNIELVGRVRAAVEPGARLLLVDWWTDPTHTQPVPAALMAGEFLANVGGDVYSEDEMARMASGGGLATHRPAPPRRPPERHHRGSRLVVRIVC